MQRFLLALICLATAAPVWAAGTLDTRFANTGVFRSPSVASGGLAGYDGFVDDAGRIIVAGVADDNAIEPHEDIGVVMRLLPNGTLDASFGTGGIVRIRPAAGFAYFPITEVAQQSSGKIIVAGLMQVGVNPEASSRVRSCRLLQSGALDPGYGVGGCATFHLALGTGHDLLTGMEVQPTEDIVFVGKVTGGSFPGYVVARLSPNGEIDQCFANAGCAGDGVLRNFAGGNSPNRLDGVVAAGDGRIMLVASSSGDILVMRLTSGGLLDTGYGINGYARITFPSVTTGQDGVWLDDGSFVVSGSDQSDTDRFAVIAKLDPNGVLDASFGIAGKQIFAYTDVSLGNTGAAMWLQDDGKLVVSGRAEPQMDGNVDERDCAVARFTADGDLDPTFGFDGKRVYNADGTGETNIHDQCNDIAGDGRRLILFGTQGLSLGTRMSVFAIGQDDLFIDGFE